MSVKVRMVCSHCGGDRVRRDADATWNADSQQWELAGVYDKGSTCDDCGGECRIVEQAIT